LTPMAARNRCLSTTPSRSGKTRGGSSGAIDTRANSVSLRLFRRAARSCKPASSRTSRHGPIPQAPATRSRSTPPCVWLGCMPVSP
jgi:hypothetical protein